MDTMHDTLLIEKLHLEGFWGQYTVDIPFHGKVNILTGNNGAGKTTIMDILYSLLVSDPDASVVRSKYRNARLSLSENSEVSVCYIQDGASKIDYIYHGESVTYDIFSRNIKSIAVSNFDTGLLSIDVIKKFREDNPKIHTDMDIQLQRWINVYYQYMTSVSRKVETMISKSDSDMNQISTLYRYSRQMEFLCNDFFHDSKTWQVRDDGKIFFKLKDQDKMISPEDLSSGEKQILTLLISTLVQDGQKGIVFWDEPEISLHIVWQQKLIRTLQTLNPNMQLIIATHSPNILYEGWEQRVINVKSTFRHE